MTSTPTIQDTPPARYADAGRLLGTAFAYDPQVVGILGERRGATERATQMSRVYTQLQRAGRGRGRAVHVAEADAVVAACIYYPAGAFPLSWYRQLRMALPGLRMSPRAAARSLAWARAMKRVHPREPHVYLEVLGVAEDQRGKGLGGALIRHVLADADAAGVGAWVETAQPNNLGLYERHGFALTHELVAAGVTNWCLWRPPGSTR